MKYRKLQVEYEYDFNLFGLTTAAKGYKLAWTVNNALNTDLIATNNISFTLRDNRTFRLTAFEYAAETFKYLLFQNRLRSDDGVDAGFMLPEMARIDYFLRIDGETYPNTPDKVLSILRNLLIVDYCVRIDINKLRSKENLLLY